MYRICGLILISVMLSGCLGSLNPFSKPPVSQPEPVMRDITAPSGEMCPHYVRRSGKLTPTEAGAYIAELHAVVDAMCPRAR